MKRTYYGSTNWRAELAIPVRLALLLALAISSPGLWAQDHDRDHDRDQHGFSRIEPGTVLAVRTTDGIDSDRGDRRVYNGILDQDIRGENGRVAIPRGSIAELIVRVGRDNDLILDLESVVVNGQRFGIRTDPKRIEARRDDSLVGNIIGAINGGQGHGSSVRVPRDSIVTFRLTQPLDIGVPDRGNTRDGRHYHDDHDNPNRDR